MQVREVFDSQSSERRQRRVAEDPSFRDPCSWDDDPTEAESPIRRRPDRCDGDTEDLTRILGVTTEDLARLIRRELRKGDIIGVTFLVDGNAVIFTGRYRALEGYVLVVENLFIDHTFSFIPLSDITSIEIGCGLRQADDPVRLPGGPLV